MKKFFTLSLLLVFALTVNADGKYWDFSKWSPTTVAQVKGSTDWTNDEKGDGSSNVVPDNACMWNVGGTIDATCDADGNLMAGGAVIEELKGLKWTGIGAKKVAMAFDYQVTTDANKWGPYNGVSYLWLNGKTTAVHFTIPAVDPGTVIKMGIESHKPSDARGIDLYVDGTKVDKDPADYPTTYAEYSWTIPGEAGGEPVDVDVQPSNGCHIYFIQVGDGGSPSTEDAKKVAYLGTSDDFTVGMFDASVVDATVVDAIPALADLQENYEALVIGAGATDAQLAALKDIIAFFPVVNTNPALYAALGQGSAAEAASSTLTIADTNNAIFDGLDEAIETTGISALTLGDYFANDQILAKAGDAVAMHVHIAGRNAYYFVPVDENTEALYQLLANAIIAASKTKKAVAAVGKPSVTFKQEDGKSIVTITAANAQTIYYTTDGSTPDLKSPVYTEPFELTQESTVRAFATGDGYTTSDGVSVLVTIATKLAAPTIAVSREAGQSTVTITAAEGAKVYYSFNANGVKKAAESTEYKEPVVITEPTDIYAFAEAENMLSSDAAQQFVGVDGITAANIRMDIITHFDANETDWYINNADILPNQSGGASAYYFWGKNAWSYYSSEVDHEETLKDSEGNDSVVYYYKPDPEALKVINPLNENGWVIKSQGQVLTGELQLAPSYAVGNGATGRYAEEADDLLPAGIENTITKGVLTFGGKTSGEPYTARVETSAKIAGPFDVVVYCGNGNSSGKGTLDIQTSADGETWETLETLKLADTQRYFKRTKASYESADEVYVRVAQTAGGTKAQIYDIYILNNGEKSKAYSEEAVGISNVKNVFAGKAAIYNLNGVRQQSMKRGLNIVIENGKARKVMKN